MARAAKLLRQFFLHTTSAALVMAALGGMTGFYYATKTTPKPEEIVMYEESMRRVVDTLRSHGLNARDIARKAVEDELNKVFLPKDEGKILEMLKFTSEKRIHILEKVRTSAERNIEMELDKYLEKHPNFLKEIPQLKPKLTELRTMYKKVKPLPVGSNQWRFNHAMTGIAGGVAIGIGISSSLKRKERMREFGIDPRRFKWPGENKFVISPS